MSLRTIVAAVGGDLYAGGRRANVPAPGHSPRDRSVSLLLSDGRVIAHGFGGADWRAALDDLRRRGLVDGDGRLTGAACGPAEPPQMPAVQRLAAAQALWASCGPVRRRSPAALYAEQRAIRRPLFGIPALRMHAAAPLSVYRPGRAARPALIAAVTAADGVLTALEITYLRPNGRIADELRLPRKTVGTLPASCAVRLDAPAEVLLVGEGVFTTLSAGERFALPAWALLSTSNLRRWAPPPGVRRVVIAADRGADGEASAGRLARRLGGEGVIATIHLPPAPFGDWNDLAMAERAQAAARQRVMASGGQGKEEGRRGAPGTGGMSPPAGRRPPHDQDRSHRDRAGTRAQVLRPQGHRRSA